MTLIDWPIKWFTAAQNVNAELQKEPNDNMLISVALEGWNSIIRYFSSNGFCEVVPYSNSSMKEAPVQVYLALEVEIAWAGTEVLDLVARRLSNTRERVSLGY